MPAETSQLVWWKHPFCSNDSHEGARITRSHVCYLGYGAPSLLGPLMRRRLGAYACRLLKCLLSKCFLMTIGSSLPMLQCKTLEAAFIAFRFH